MLITGSMRGNVINGKLNTWIQLTKPPPWSFPQVAEAKSKAEEAKGKAQAALDKATATKNMVERSNNDLRDLIKQTREFLTRESLGQMFTGLHTKLCCLFLFQDSTTNKNVIRQVCE